MSDPRHTISAMENDELIATAQPIVWRRGDKAGLSKEDPEELPQEAVM